jgi:hypothetical protein
MPATVLPRAGYSGRPLADKLGFKAGMAVAFIGLPEELSDLAGSVDLTRADRVQYWADLIGTEGCYDAIHAFTTSRTEIDQGLSVLQLAIRTDGMIWVSWPKKASKVSTDVTEDVVRGEALKLDLVDVKVAAIDETWSALKLVIRKERRQ